MKDDISGSPEKTPPSNTLLGFVPLTDSRTVVVFLDKHGGQRHVKLSTYSRNRKKGHWYLTKAYYTVRIECTAALGQALIDASKGRPFGDEPEWWQGYQAEYKQWKASQPAQADQTPDRSEQS